MSKSRGKYSYSVQLDENGEAHLVVEAQGMHQGTRQNSKKRNRRRR